jgi:hypothetical protein
MPAEQPAEDADDEAYRGQKRRGPDPADAGEPVQAYEQGLIKSREKLHDPPDDKTENGAEDGAEDTSDNCSDHHDITFQLPST